MLHEYFDFKFKTTEFRGWPSLVFRVDGDTVLDHRFQHDSETVRLACDFAPGPHHLEIERYGKNDHNVDFRDGKIWQDQTVELESIAVAGVTLPQSFLFDGVWRWNDTVETGALFWGPNGVWSWNFELPMIDWALRYHRKNRIPHPDLLDPITDDTTELKRQLTILEGLLQQHD